MVTLIEEPVEMSAVFNRKKILPVSFVWRERRYRVARVAGAHRQRKGQFVEIYYSVLTGEGEDVYELRFSTESMNWSLVRIQRGIAGGDIAVGNFSMHGLMRAADQRLASPEPEAPGEAARAGGGRCVLHLDMDAYFAAVEQRDHPLYRGVPLVVCHTSSDFCTHGVVATASYEARVFGIKAGMSVWEARSRCPGVSMVHADIPKYLYNTRRIVRLCEKYSPRSEVFSIDEVFLDLTRRVGPGGWEEALSLAGEVKRRIREELGLTCSVGLGPNKLVAKMASEFEKPDGLTLVRPEQLPGILAPLPVNKLVGVGPRMLRNMRALGIERVGDLARAPVQVLQKRFGVMGRILHLAAQGIDHSPVGGRARAT